MDSLKLNHRVLLKKEEQGDNDNGLNTKFSIIAEVWAKIEPIAVKQNFFRMKIDQEISHIITIRYREDAKCCKKIAFNDRVFDVLGVICPDEQYDWLVFNVKELI